MTSGPDGGKYGLVLYVVGATPRSAQAIRNLRDICRRELEGDGFELEVVDLYQEPERAAEAGVVAAPTLVKESPGPVRKVIGDLSDRERVVIALGLAKHEHAS